MERTARALNLFEDVGGACRPDEWLGVVVVAIDIIADGHDQFFEIAKHARQSEHVLPLGPEATGYKPIAPKRLTGQNQGDGWGDPHPAGSPVY